MAHACDSEPDVRLHGHGSIVMVEPMTPAAHDWVTDNVPLESWQWLGGAFAAEPRMVHQLVRGMQDDGLLVGGL